MRSTGTRVVACIGGVSIALAAFVLCLEVLRPQFRDFQMSTVLAINCGVGAVLLFIAHLLLSIVPKWRHRTTLWVIGGWLLIGLGYWLHTH